MIMLVTPLQYKSDGASAFICSSVLNMSYKVDVVCESPRLLGEGPHWDQERQELFFVDALESSIFRYIPAEKRTTYCKVDNNNAYVSVVVPIKGEKDKFIVSIGRKVTIVTWDGESTKPQNIEVFATVEEGEKGKENNYFNDGKVDPTGKLWIGTMGFLKDNGELDAEKGSLYSFTNEGKEAKHLENISIANGLAWTEDLKTMYYIDTMTKRVDAFDFDEASGNISNRRTAFDFGVDIAVDKIIGPDGMAIDKDGNLWVAVFGASGIYNIDPVGKKLLRKVDIPAKNTTSVAFGGANLDELFVVSAKFLNTAPSPTDGCTFRVTGLGVKGFAGQPMKLV